MDLRVAIREYEGGIKFGVVDFILVVLYLSSFCSSHGIINFS